ncbi:PEP-utilizing enzyme [Candidatus Thiodictyon syntrophicum]|uniref:PEP-utilizing enzyme n=1 Tax=Candidatus Thiodictyon syntrophicum TaxID=1166950 RepID=UPI001F02026C|nr:PEP-utilizing enzyme [Candidatus Thiodictyon syntrophicum]
MDANPEDIHGVVASEGILTSHGGKTSDAAVVARGMGKCRVAGAEGGHVDVERCIAVPGRRSGRVAPHVSGDHQVLAAEVQGCQPPPWRGQARRSLRGAGRRSGDAARLAPACRSASAAHEAAPCDAGPSAAKVQPGDRYRGFHLGSRSPSVGGDSDRSDARTPGRFRQPCANPCRDPATHD